MQPWQHLAHRFAWGLPLGALAARRWATTSVSVCVRKTAPVPAQLLFQFAEILNDAVVYNHHIACHMGMRVRLRGSAMGCPARVANAGDARHRRFPQAVFQIAQLARRPAPLDSAVLKRCNAG